MNVKIWGPKKYFCLPAAFSKEVINYLQIARSNICVYVCVCVCVCVCKCFKIRLKNLFFVTCNVAAVVDLFRYGYVYSGAEEQFLSGEGSDTY